MKGTRPAVIARAGGGITVRAMGDGKIHVVGDEQIEPAIAVIIEKGGAGAPSGVIGFCLLRYICKSAVAVVEPHLIRAEIAEVKIRPAIVVDVANRDAHPI